MALLTWNNNYSVNIKKIDEQHQQLINLINELHDNMKIGKGKDVLGTIIKKLADYTVYHFKTEEKLFEQYNYPENRLHTEAHNVLIAKVKALQADFSSGKAILTMDVMTFLKEWLTGHIMGSDKKYSEYLNSKGVV